MTAIEARAVTVRFRDVVALDEVSLTLTGGVTALLGENGAGKTTLIRVLARLQRPSPGQVRLDGEPVSGRRAEIAYRRALGYLPQNVPTLRHLTVGQYLEYVCFLKGLPRAQVPGRVALVLDLVDLGDQRRRRTSALSGAWYGGSGSRRPRWGSRACCCSMSPRWASTPCSASSSASW